MQVLREDRWEVKGEPGPPQPGDCSSPRPKASLWSGPHVRNDDAKAPCSRLQPRLPRGLEPQKVPGDACRRAECVTEESHLCYFFEIKFTYNKLHHLKVDSNGF